MDKSRASFTLYYIFALGQILYGIHCFDNLKVPDHLLQNEQLQPGFGGKFRHVTHLNLVSNHLNNSSQCLSSIIMKTVVSISLTVRWKLLKNYPFKNR